ncbi:unnamed protein product [Toxocara canis]|uniref:Uncharacterized protein n=1 Tax=Toxocara canis TaxID=6265 RepID=A0A3P7GZT8_TOXCA|nr:unnamed protein product [Toxocara canis]
MPNALADIDIAGAAEKLDFRTATRGHFGVDINVVGVNVALVQRIEHCISFHRIECFLVIYECKKAQRTVLRYRELLLMEASSKHYLEGNSTPAEDYLEDLLPKSEVGSFDQSFLDTNSDLLKFMEHAYNLLHLFSICILPYSIELLCYAIILVLMKRVNKDIRRDGSSGKRCGVLFCCARAKENVHSKALNSCCTELKTDCNVEFKPVGGGLKIFLHYTGLIALKKD